MSRLIEAELLFQLCDELRVQSLGAAILAVGVFGGGGSRAAPPTVGNFRADISGNASRGFHALTLYLCDQSFDWPAGRDLYHGEVHHHDAEQCRDDEQQTAKNISEHDAEWT